MELKTISAKILADSIDSRGHRATTFLLVYPRWIQSELLTHRLFSRNALSSRALPFNKMVESIESDPFIPTAWQKAHKGMQGSEYINELDAVELERNEWIEDSKVVLERAKLKHERGVTKQICNRLLEPFQWFTSIVTATEFDNFFDLRNPKYFGAYKSWNDAISSGATCETPFEFRPNDSTAEIHIQLLAEAMWDARNKNNPTVLQAGEWHIPFGDRISAVELLPVHYKVNNIPNDNAVIVDVLSYQIKIATARCARISYATHDGEIDYEKDLKLYGTLLKQKHASAFEHCLKAMSDEEYDAFTHTSINPETDEYSVERGWCRNYRGFISHRYEVGL